MRLVGNADCTQGVVRRHGSEYVASQKQLSIVFDEVKPPKARSYRSEPVERRITTMRRWRKVFEMIKEIIHDSFLLARKSEAATAEDLPIAHDLLDTLVAHREECVGMAANMIGEFKRIIAFLDGSGREPIYTVMLNPEIIKRDGIYETEEGCLSLLGGPRKCKRYKSIKVQYQTTEMQTRTKTYTGWTAQIIQHEVDHCNGILI